MFGIGLFRSDFKSTSPRDCQFWGSSVTVLSFVEKASRFVQISPQVHISERLSALGLTRHGFILCRKGASIGLKCMSVVYKLPFASSTKRCWTILVYPEQGFPAVTAGLAVRS
ncbi:hypothetical protein QL285_019011 [Trifolium repens]|nr:hypothetical protein QL285_019011 [Trifolium repens]